MTSFRQLFDFYIILNVLIVINIFYNFLKWMINRRTTFL